MRLDTKIKKKQISIITCNICHNCPFDISHTSPFIQLAISILFIHFQYYLILSYIIKFDYYGRDSIHM